MRRTAPRLSSDEVALVLRRAADLEAEAERPAAPGGVEPAAVEEAAREVGLSPEAVRQALAELHAGALGPSGRSGRRGLAARSPAGVAAHVAVEARLVAAEADTVHATTADFLRREAFGLRRHHAGQAVYHRRTDVGARARRLVHAGGSMQLSGVRTVTVAVTALDTSATPVARGAAEPVAAGDGRVGDAGGSGRRHLVRVEAEVASNRLGDRLRAAGAAAAAGTTLAVAGLLAGLGLLAVAGGVAGGVAARLWLGRRLRQRRRDEVREVLAALLDAVEDPSSRDRLTAGRPAWLHWSSSGSALSRGSWRSARGWARTSWSFHTERTRDKPPAHPADGRAGPRHT
jgi:hypothetical protein